MIVLRSMKNPVLVLLILFFTASCGSDASSDAAKAADASIDLTALPGGCPKASLSASFRGRVIIL